jgi:diguanylate cyclase (GGDEF)-like protein
MLIVVVFGILAQTVFLNSYRELELAETRSEVNHVYATLNSEIENLTNITSDWAVWDDTYRFVQDKNQAYLDSNLVNSTFDGLGINLFLLLDKNGEIVYQKAYDLESKKIIPVPEELMLYLKHNAGLLDLGVNDIETGCISIENTPLLVSVSPVLTSNQYGPSRGTLVFGKFIKGKLLERIKNATIADLRILPYDANLIPASSQIAYLDATDHYKFYYQASGNEEMDVYSILNDYNGNPTFIIEMVKNRAIFLQGLSSILTQLLAIVLTSLTAGGIMLATLDHNLLSRLGKLIQSVNKFRSAPQEALSTELTGNDELSILSIEIDQTLHHLLHAQNQLYQNLEYENFIVDISTRLINLPITQINKAIQIVLETIGKQIDAESGHILYFNYEDIHLPSELYEWNVDEKYSIKKQINAKLFQSFTWGSRKFHERANVVFSDFEELPNSAIIEKAFCKKYQILSAICIPLKFADNLGGMISFESHSHFHIWDEQAVKILEIIANIITNAIDRRQKEKQLQLNQQFQFRLNQITKTSIAKDSCAASMRALSRHLSTLIGSDRGVLILLKDAQNYEVYEAGKRMQPYANMDRLVHFLRIKNREGLLVYGTSDLKESKKWPELTWLGESIIAISLKGRKQHLGWIILADRKSRNYKNQEIAVCRQAASQITLSIIKIISLEESREISRELRDLRTAVAEISSELDLKQLRSKVLERAAKLIRGEGGIFYVYDEETRELHYTNSLNLKKPFNPTPVSWGEGASGKSVQLKRTLAISNYSKWKYRDPDESFSYIKSTIATPLVIGDRILGSMLIFRYDPSQNFSKNDQHLVNIFAQHASIAIENATLFQKVQEMARQDEVTGLLNRRALNEIGEYELARSLRLNRPIAVAMVDLDNYKEINDKHNHLIGDKVLKEISRIFRENVRNIDIVGRYGGDECVIIMPETDLENAYIATERIRSVLEEHAIEVEGLEFHITACFGISAYMDKPPSLEKMIDEADTAMYAAKEAGRNAIRVFQNL